jgi:hypothetical protein
MSVLGLATSDELLAAPDGSLRIYPSDCPEARLPDEAPDPSRRKAVA